MKKIFITIFIGISIFFSSFLFAFTYLPLKYATDFRVKYLGNGLKLITDGVGRKILLVPSRNSKNALKQHKKVDAIIYIPVKRVIVRWTTIPPLLKVLGVVNSVVGVTAPKKDWYIKEIREQMNEGKTFYIGEYKSINYELLKALKPDIFFAGEWENTEILKEINLPFAVVCEYREKNPLGRLEWIKFFSAFYNKENIAIDFFKKVENRVNEIIKKVSKVKEKPKVLWGFVSLNQMAYVPRGDSYVAKMIEMAGGDYVFKNFTASGTGPISLEEFYRQGKKADIFISTGTLPNYGITSISKFLLRHPMLKDLKPIKEGKVWCFQPWYWESIDKTDEIINDLAAIFHPELYPGYTPKYFLKLPP